LAPLKGSLRVSDMFASRAVDTTVKKIWRFMQMTF
jgi:hypothetical protein